MGFFGGASWLPGCDPGGLAATPVCCATLKFWRLDGCGPVFLPFLRVRFCSVLFCACFFGRAMETLQVRAWASAVFGRGCASVESWRRRLPGRASIVAGLPGYVFDAWRFRARLRFLLFAGRAGLPGGLDRLFLPNYNFCTLSTNTAPFLLLSIDRADLAWKSSPHKKIMPAGLIFRWLAEAPLKKSYARESRKFGSLAADFEFALILRAMLYLDYGRLLKWSKRAGC